MNAIMATMKASRALGVAPTDALSVCPLPQVFFRIVNGPK
jgi:hypothetical protein